MANDAFFWGQGGQKLTPAQAKARREMADALLADNSAATSFGGGLAKIGQALQGVALDKQASAAEAEHGTQRKAIMDALMGNPDPTMADIYSALGNDVVSSDATSTAIINAMMGDERQQASWAREDARYAQDVAREDSRFNQTREWQLDDRNAGWTREDQLLADQNTRQDRLLADEVTRNQPMLDANLAHTEAQTAALQAKPAVPLTDDQREYAQAKEEGFTGTLQDWIAAKPAASGVTVNTGDNSSAFAKKADENAAARLDTIIQEGNSASRFLGDIQQLVNLGTQVETGQGTAILAQLGPWAEMAGISIDGLGPAQAYESIIARMAPAMRPAGSGASSDFDARQFLTSLPQLRNSPEGNKLITDTFAAIQQNKMAAAEIASLSMLPADAGGITWQEAEKRIRELPNPYETFRQTNGGGGSASAAPAPSAVQAPPPPAVGEVVEGHRFLGGDPANMNSWERVM